MDEQIVGGIFRPKLVKVSKEEAEEKEKPED